MFNDRIFNLIVSRYNWKKGTVKIWNFSLFLLLNAAFSRQPLVLISLVATSAALITLGVGATDSTNNWTTYMSVLSISFFHSLGFGTLEPVIITEWIHPKVRVLFYFAGK